jgi:hypothetical protein
MKSLPRNRLKFIPGQNVKVTKDIYRRSFGHINSIKETLVEENKENLDAGKHHHSLSSLRTNFSS